MNVTTILNVYKRPQFIMHQIACLKKQTTGTDIWIDWTCPKGEDHIHNEYLQEVQDTFPEIPINFHINQNLYHFGRLYYAMNAQTDYVFILDDDMFPSPAYLELALQVFEHKDDCGAVCGYGVDIDREGYGYETKHRWGWHHLRKNRSTPLRTVDMGGHSWLMLTNDLREFMSDKPISIENGEDLFLSNQISLMVAKVYVFTDHQGNPETYVTDPEKSWKIGNDENATWKRDNHKAIRDEIVEAYKSDGWLE